MPSEKDLSNSDALNIDALSADGAINTHGVRQSSRVSFPKRAIVTAGMPYGNKGLHFGHLAGVFIPADIYARFLRDRIGAKNVLFVSGTDCYGSPINEGHRKACEAGSFSGSLADYVGQNHKRQAQTLNSYGISLDIFEGSSLGASGEEQQKMTDVFVTKLYKLGWLEKRETLQFFDDEAQTFLNGRQVQGRCPVQGCKAEKAFADECGMGHQYQPEDLIAPKSTLTGQTPSLKPVINWYFKLPEFASLIEEHMKSLDGDIRQRKLTAETVREFLVPPIIYIQDKFMEQYESVKDELPKHVYKDPEKGKQSFTLEFADIDARDEAKTLLANSGVRFRTGKALVPFRITGNISWGVKAPELDGSTPEATIWCWPESLWAPIAFSNAALKKRSAADSEAAGAGVATKGGAADDETGVSGKDNDADSNKDAWREWWCSDDACAYQFIGQDNLYFYGVAQTALFAATQEGSPVANPTSDNLRQTVLVPDYHALFLGKKASSSSEVPPPSADDLLDYYNAWQLRVHWASLGLDERPTSFSPKVLDPAHKDEDKYPDPVLKESALLTNIFNRIARSCFYTAQKLNDGKAPLDLPSKKALDWTAETAQKYEELMYETKIHDVFSLTDGFLRDVNKWWASASREASNAAKEAVQQSNGEHHAGVDGAAETAAGTETAKTTVDAEVALLAAQRKEMLPILADLFYYLHAACVFMHPFVPDGCELIFEYLDIKDFSEHPVAKQENTSSEDVPEALYSSGQFQFKPHAGFFSWDHILEPIGFWADDAERKAGAFSLKELPAHFDFFTKHESQI